MYYNNDWLAYLAHSRKGSTWKNHKYLRKENGVYIYAENVANSAKELSGAAKDAVKANKEYKKEKADAAKAERDYNKGKKAEYKTREEIDKNVAARDEAKSRIRTPNGSFLGMTTYKHDANAAKEAREYSKKVDKSVEKLNSQIQENKTKERLAKRESEHAAYKGKLKDEATQKLANAGKKFANSLFGKNTETGSKPTIKKTEKNNATVYADKNGKKLISRNKRVTDSETVATIRKRAIRQPS